MLGKKKKVSTSRVRRRRSGGIGIDPELVDEVIGATTEAAAVIAEETSRRDEPSGSCASESSDPGGCDGD